LLNPLQSGEIGREAKRFRGLRLLSERSAFMRRSLTGGAEAQKRNDKENRRAAQN
jgi:hypothetical protein